MSHERTTNTGNIWIHVDCIAHTNEYHRYIYLRLRAMVARNSVE